MVMKTVIKAPLLCPLHAGGVLERMGPGSGSAPPVPRGPAGGDESSQRCDPHTWGVMGHPPDLPFSPARGANVMPKLALPSMKALSSLPGVCLCPLGWEEGAGGRVGF